MRFNFFLFLVLHLFVLHQVSLLALDAFELTFKRLKDFVHRLLKSD